MTKIANLLGMVTGVALAIGVAGCDRETTAEKQVEAQANAIDEGYQADAKLVEANAEGTAGEEQAEKQADALRDKGDAVEDDLKKEAVELGRDTRNMPEAAQPKD
jgi:hypothetical protein